MRIKHEKRPKGKEVLEILLEVSRKTSSSLEIGEVSNSILKHAKEFLNADYSALFLLDEKTRRLNLIGAQGFKGDQTENLMVLAGWERINAELVKKSKAIIVNDISKNPVFKNEHIPFDAQEKLHFGAFLAVPLKKGTQLVGAIIVSHSKRRKAHFTEQDKKMLYALGNHVSTALLNAKLHRDLKELFLNTVASLATAVDARDPYTRR